MDTYGYRAGTGYVHGEKLGADAEGFMAPSCTIISASQEAWKNTSFAYELGKCLVDAKKKERDHLLQEPRCNRFKNALLQRCDLLR